MGKLKIKKTLYIALLFLISCSTSNLLTKHDQSRKRKNPPKTEFDKTLDTVLTCNIYQFTAFDSINIALCKVVKYDKNNNLLYEEFFDFKESSYEGTANAIHNYYYKDGLLVEIITKYTTPSFTSEESSKAIFYYNNQSKLVKSVYYNLKRRLKPNVDKGFGSSGGCTLVEDDFEKESKWEIDGVINYKYDSLNRVIEYYAPSIFWTSQNRYTWTYNDNGKINEYVSYEDEKVIWIEKFSYTDSSYQFIRTWYDNDGNPKHLKEKQWEYTPQVNYTYILDSQNRVIEEIVVNEKSEFINRTTTEYNELGLVSKTIRYDQNNKPDITHIYKYK